MWLGEVHIEHGHSHDPDNAPAHPVVVGGRPLGVHFSAEFIHPTDTHRYLQANDGTPLNLFLAAFRWYRTAVARAHQLVVMRLAAKECATLTASVQNGAFSGSVGG